MHLETLLLMENCVKAKPSVIAAESLYIKKGSLSVIDIDRVILSGQDRKGLD